MAALCVAASGIAFFAFDDAVEPLDSSIKLEVAALSSSKARVAFTFGVIRRSKLVLYDAGERLGYVCFPTTCIVSLVFSAANGSTAELAIASNDGLVGVSMVLGGDTTTLRAVVQCGGQAYRLRADLAGWELDQPGGLLLAEHRGGLVPRP